MRDDLLDAYAANDWAVAQLKSLHKRIADWHARPAYAIAEEDQLEMGKKLFKLRTDERVGDRLINTEIGAIINSLRSALDLVAASLARRNGILPTADHHFPIKRSQNDFIDPVQDRKFKKWLNPAEIRIIKDLHPYPGGNDKLWALHHMDVTRKHDRLIRITPIPSQIAISPEAHAQGLQFPAQWPGFYDGAVIAWTVLGATNADFQIVLDIRFDEATLLPGEPIIPALRDFARMVGEIIQRFEAT